MNKLLARLNNSYRRAGFAVVGLFLAFAGILPTLILTTGSASAFNQVTSRSITMSSSVPGATGVTYKLTFTPVTTLSNPDVLLDFCSNDPLILDSCTATAGTDVPNFSSAAASGWTLTTLGSGGGAGRGVKLTTTTVNFTGGSPVTITITNVTNPTNSGVSGSFYARLLVYPNGTAGSFDSVTPGTGYDDYGGIALSTTQNVTVTSKVFETLSFCVYTASCGTSAALALGNAVTGALSTSTAYVNSGASYSIATNAYHGVVVTMTGQTLCNQSVLNFTNCPTGASTNTITAMTSNGLSTPGSPQFGMCAYNGGNASITIDSPYADGVNNCNGITTGAYSGSSDFGFDDSNGGNGTNGVNGSKVLQSSGPLLATVGNFTFLGNISATTTAGIYNSSLNMVATGTF